MFLKHMEMMMINPKLKVTVNQEQNMLQRTIQGFNSLAIFYSLICVMDTWELFTLFFIILGYLEHFIII